MRLLRVLAVFSELRSARGTAAAPLVTSWVTVDITCHFFTQALQNRILSDTPPNLIVGIYHAHKNTFR